MKLNGKWLVTKERNKSKFKYYAPLPSIAFQQKNVYKLYQFNSVPANQIL